jgi:large conductance mechanosensitive channel
MFLFVVKFLGWMMRSRREEPPKPVTKDQELLAEIRDLLRKQAGEPGTPLEKT